MPPGIAVESLKGGPLIGTRRMKLDRQECNTLPNVFDRMIEISEPRRAENYRGTAEGYRSAFSACWKKR